MRQSPRSSSVLRGDLLCKQCFASQCAKGNKKDTLWGVKTHYGMYHLYAVSSNFKGRLNTALDVRCVC